MSAKMASGSSCSHMLPSGSRTRRPSASTRRKQDDRNDQQQRLRCSQGVVKGGVEPPTFRFSGAAYAKLTPNHASAAGCRRSFLLAVGCRCCCHRCCQPSLGARHVRDTHDAALRRSSQNGVLAENAKVPRPSLSAQMFDAITSALGQWGISKDISSLARRLWRFTGRPLPLQ